MVELAVEGTDLFKIAGRSISGWIASLKKGNPGHVRQPFCSQLEERHLEYHPPGVLVCLWQYWRSVCEYLPSDHSKGWAMEKTIWEVVGGERK